MSSKKNVNKLLNVQKMQYGVSLSMTKPQQQDSSLGAFLLGEKNEYV